MGRLVLYVGYVIARTIVSLSFHSCLRIKIDAMMFGCEISAILMIDVCTGC